MHFSGFFFVILLFSHCSNKPTIKIIDRSFLCQCGKRTKSAFFPTACVISVCWFHLGKQDSFRQRLTDVIMKKVDVKVALTHNCTSLYSTNISTSIQKKKKHWRWSKITARTSIFLSKQASQEELFAEVRLPTGLDSFPPHRDAHEIYITRLRWGHMCSVQITNTAIVHIQTYSFSPDVLQIKSVRMTSSCR